MKIGDWYILYTHLRAVSNKKILKLFGFQVSIYIKANN